MRLSRIQMGRDSMTFGLLIKANVWTKSHKKSVSKHSGIQKT
jgi:hypothetical protein